MHLFLCTYLLHVSNMSFDLCPLPVLLFWYHSDLRSFIYFSCSFSGSFPDLSNPVDTLVRVLLWKFGEQFWCNNVCSSILGNFIMISLTISFLFSLFSLFSTTSLFQGQLSSRLNYICKAPLPCKGHIQKLLALICGCFWRTAAHHSFLEIRWLSQRVCAFLM